MKRFLVFILASLMLLPLAGCIPVSDGGGKPQGGQSELSTKAPISGAEPITDGSKAGVLQRFTNSTDYVIRGLLITSGSGHHNYPGIDELVGKGYKSAGLYDEYTLNEWFEVYAQVTDDKAADIYIIANDENADYGSMSAADIAAISEKEAYPVFFENAAPDVKDNGKLFSAYINSDMPAGLYNIFFTHEGTIRYLVQLKIVDEN